MSETETTTEVADPKVLLAHHLKKLKLPTILAEYDKQARLCAEQGIDHPRYLLRLAELELIERERKMVERRIRAAKFPAPKSLDSFDFKAIPTLNKLLVLELARCAFVARRENIIALGPSGTGKTHVATGLGLAACQKGMRVGFVTAAGLVNQLSEARDEKRLLRLQTSLAKLELLIIDELGLSVVLIGGPDDRSMSERILGNEGPNQINLTGKTDLQEAAAIMEKTPITLQLRYLQTLTEIAAEKNSTLVFPLPIEMLEAFMRKAPG